MKTIITAFFLSFVCICQGFSETHVFEEQSFKVISGKEARLNGPEGIAFSPDGKFVAIANSGGTSIVFYELDGSNIPVFELKGPETLLEYPHDLAFSSNGDYLAVASRHNRIAMIFKKIEGRFAYHSTPIHVFQDPSFGEIGSIAYSPVENLIAFGDTYLGRIFVYSFDGEKYQDTPSWKFENPHLLTIVDGLSFTPDGKFLAVVSKLTDSIVFFERTPNSQNLFTTAPGYILRKKGSLLQHPHSLVFHPTKDLLIVSCCDSNSIKVYKKDIKKKCSYFSSPIQILHEYGKAGNKGVAFSPDGKILGVCIPSQEGKDEVRFFREKE